MAKEDANREQDGDPGIPVDYRGRRTIDPTKNVLDLVRAESKYQDAMRESLAILINEKVGGLKEIAAITNQYVGAFQNAQRDSETRRIDQLAENRQEFQNTIRDMLAESVRTTSNLVASQLAQIQATFDTRVSKLEAGAFTQAGKSSVSDPATAEALTRMAAGIAALSATTTEAMNKTAAATAEAIAKLTLTLTGLQSVENRSGGNAMGREQTNARLLAVVMAVAAVASPVVSILITIMVMRGH